MTDHGNTSGLGLTLSRSSVLVPGMERHDEYGNCLPDICDCEYARECRSDDPIPVCRNCQRAIWRHIYGGDVVWRHFNGLMLCQPDEDASDFTGIAVAEPLGSDDRAEATDA